MDQLDGLGTVLIPIGSKLVCMNKLYYMHKTNIHYGARTVHCEGAVHVEGI